MKRTSISHPEDRIFTLPNLLTVIRILLIPVCLYAYLWRQRPIEAAVILLLSGITDVLDGLIARHTGAVSTLGKILDPLADKLTQLSLLFALIRRYNILLLIAIPLLIKETVSGIASLWHIRRFGQVDSSRAHGKMTTVAIYTTLMLHLLVEYIPSAVSLSLCILCLCLLLFSFILYMSAHLTPPRREATGITPK